MKAKERRYIEQELTRIEPGEQTSILDDLITGGYTRPMIQELANDAGVEYRDVVKIADALIARGEE